MARTERLSATEDRDGMLTEVNRPLPVPDRKAIKQYLSTVQIVTEYASLTQRDSASRHGEVVNYWKAAPYTLSFLDTGLYQALRGLENYAGSDVPGNERLIKLLADSPAVLPWDTIGSAARSGDRLGHAA